MSNQLDAVRGKVQRYLTSAFGRVEVDNDGDFTIRHESARLFVSCHEWRNGESTVVELACPILSEVPESPELFRYVATENNWLFGSLACRPSSDGQTINVLFSHSLLGDYLDEEELTRAVIGVLGTGNDLDDQLQAKFGGKRFHEDG